MYGWELDHKESWMTKNWCFWTVVLEKTLESPLDCKIKPVNPKGNQTWIFMGRTDAEAEAWILWPPDVKSWLIGKDPDSGTGWRQEKKRMRWLDGITNSMDMNLSKHQEIVKDKKLWHPSVHGVTKSWTWLSYWTTTSNKHNLIGRFRTQYQISIEYTLFSNIWNIYQNWPHADFQS